MPRLNQGAIKLFCLLEMSPHGLTTQQLARHNHRFSARLQELRQLGCNITSSLIADGQYQYRLCSAPQSLRTQIAIRSEES